MSSNNNLNLYLHPELSLLAFNERVLQLAMDKDIPLLERLKFLCIFSSNMDEFFEIRVSGLKARANSNITAEGIDGLTPMLALEQISEKAHRLVDLQYQTLNETILPALQNHGIRFLGMNEWSDAQQKWLAKYFKREILPILTPIRLDPAHPFPLTINKGLAIVVDLLDAERDEAHNIAVVPLPRALPRIIRVPSYLSDLEYEHVFLSSVIHAHINQIFTSVEALGCYQMRITRNSDLYVDLEEVDDLARTLEGELPSRLYGEAIRLEVSKNCPKRIIKFLQNRFSLDPSYVYQVDGPVNLNRLISLPDMVNRPLIKYAAFTPSIPNELSQQADLFEAITGNDILLHHPFQSFTPVVELLKQAAHDPDVLVIKQTLYRTGADSIVIQHLADAARAGKEVTVVVELMARFDEQNNLATAQKLQQSGAHVVYGLVGKKTHAKMLMIVRKEGKKLKRYVHLGTGNYHQANTRVYTDYGLLTNDKKITSDVHELFMQLTTQGPNPELQSLIQSPFGISNLLEQKIAREADNAQQGKPARIIAKVNGLSSPSIIDALYKASQAGVEIDLIVRGICCLRPKLKGISQNIRVRSVIGRFLEHGRVFYFENHQAADGPDVFLSSADLMPRNLRNRIEHCAPINDPRLKSIIISDLELYLKDNTGAWEMQSNGSYVSIAQRNAKSNKPTEPFNAQQQLMNRFAEVL